MLCSLLLKANSLITFSVVDPHLVTVNINYTYCDVTISVALHPSFPADSSGGSTRDELRLELPFRLFIHKGTLSTNNSGSNSSSNIHIYGYRNHNRKSPLTLKNNNNSIWWYVTLTAEAFPYNYSTVTIAIMTLTWL